MQCQHKIKKGMPVTHDLHKNVIHLHILMI
jgi:hypothetical protein